MKKCKFYSEYDSGQHDFGVCHYDEYKYKGFPMICTHKDNEENCTCFEPIKEHKNESKNMKKCKFYAETARRGWCSNTDCLLEKCYFSDNFNGCELFEPTKCEKESSPSALKYDKKEPVKLMLDESRSIDKTALTIQNCEKIILKPKSLEVEVKIEKDNFGDFDYIVINGIKFKREK